MDISVLRTLNAGESFSLLNCPKKVTLAIKEYRMPTVIQSSLSPNNPATEAGVRTTVTKEDYTATNAHNLANYFREMKIEAYVLHTPLSSIVCVGGFDSATDPRLRTFKANFNVAMQNYGALQELRLFADPWPMQVPR
jgi:hypothetical protein